MERVYFNGRFCDPARAGLSLDDRGHLFGDGVYEVVRYYGGRPFRMADHVERLRRSLAGIELTGVDPGALAEASDTLVRQQGLTDAKAYWQATRGVPADVAERDHLITDAPPRPTVFILVGPVDPLTPGPVPSQTATVVEDCRWSRCWIKSTMLLPCSLARTHARRRGFGDALFERHKPNGSVHLTEASAANLFLVDAGAVRTHPADRWILGGVTRLHLLELCGRLGIPAVEQPFDRAALMEADEAFTCGTTHEVTAVTAVDGRPIGTGRSGPIAQRLWEAFVAEVAGGAGAADGGGVQPPRASATSAA